MKAEHATWETGLVIPESTKPIPEQTLDALLRIEELLQKLVEAMQPIGIIGSAELEQRPDLTEAKPAAKKAKAK
jgi:hypothetical protein